MSDAPVGKIVEATEGTREVGLTDGAPEGDFVGLVLSAGSVDEKVGFRLGVTVVGFHDGGVKLSATDVGNRLVDNVGAKLVGTILLLKVGNVDGAVGSNDGESVKSKLWILISSTS